MMYTTNSILEKNIRSLYDNDPTLTALNLRHISTASTKCISAALKANRTLTTLILALYSNRIDDTVAKHLAAALQVNRTLTTLDLSYNNISDVGAEQLAAA